MSFYWVTNTPVLDFKARVDGLIRMWGRHICGVYSLRFPSGVTPADILMAPWQPVTVPHMHVSADVQYWIQTGNLPHSSLTH